MAKNPTTTNSEELLRLAGIVERVTFHNPENGWSVLKVSPFREPERLVCVLIYQAKVYAGATMEFWGTWASHPKHGEQFKAVRAIEKKPASTAALEKYLGSGLIRGVGPQIAKRIASHFGEQTLAVFEQKIELLKQVPGIADKKLEMIRHSWQEHRSIRDVMLFLQGHGISTLFAVKIFRAYGDRAIELVSQNPYRLAQDIYGIGFFSADKVALALGFDPAGAERFEAAIRHVLAASRESGHCFLTAKQIREQLAQLLGEIATSERISETLTSMVSRNLVKLRKLGLANESSADCYYSKSLYFDERTVAERVLQFCGRGLNYDLAKLARWVEQHCGEQKISLSSEQASAAVGAASQAFSVLTGGPGCGKTTTTRVIVDLLHALGKRVLLAAPTGRAAQRMSEVIGHEAKTIHRLLGWTPALGGFAKNAEDPLEADHLIVDECSMLDISLAASLLKAVPNTCQILFIGDPDQLPAVGAGNVLQDLLRAPCVAQFRLTKVFRQAEKSQIIRYAHQINAGVIPKVTSPLAHPKCVSSGCDDCVFVDSDEATQTQLQFLARAKAAIRRTEESGETHLLKSGETWLGSMSKGDLGVQVSRENLALLFPENCEREDLRAPILNIPEKFRDANLERLAQAEGSSAELMAILKTVHPWSSLHFGLTAVDSVIRLYTKSVSQWLGLECEVQVLTPQVRGSLGTANLNAKLQEAANPPAPGKAQLQLGERLFRQGDRVIQTRNNYDLGVFNGDIGMITSINPGEMSCEVRLGDRDVNYSREDLLELQLAYAITIHKSQGSEFPVVILPVASQHHNMLFRNLVYTGLTRAKRLAIFVGSRRAFAYAIHQRDNRLRQTALRELLCGELELG